MTTKWRDRLHNVYADLEEFRGYCRLYNIHKRIGFRSVIAAWRANPLIEGSVNPQDLRRIK